MQNTSQGDIYATSGNIYATAGNIDAGGSMSAGTFFDAGTSITAGTTITASGEIDMGFILDFKNAAGNGLPEERAEQFRDVCRRWLATHDVPTKEETVALEQRLVDA